MVLISYSGREINAKLVYYGPGLSGKTTNLEYIYGAVPQTHRGQMVSMKTKTERTLFFDFLPIDLGELAGFKTRFLLYTVPGQVYYNATRKLVLKGVDAVVFVADSKRGKMDENLESLANLRDNLRELGLDLDRIPWVIQYNKRDLGDVYSIDELEKALNPGRVPSFEAVATSGQGVFETFKSISRLLLKHLSQEVGVRVVASPADSAPAPAAEIPPPAAEIPPPAAVDSPAVPAEAISPESPAGAAPPADGEAPAIQRSGTPWTGELLRANPVAPEAPEEETERSVFEASESDELDRPHTMGERLRRWFGRTREFDSGDEAGSSDDGGIPPPADWEDEGEVSIEEDLPERVEPDIEPVEPPRVATIETGVPVTAIRIESPAPHRAEAARREIPILVDLEPEDLERGVVLKLRIAMRARDDAAQDEGGDEFPRARAA